MYGRTTPTVDILPGLLASVYCSAATREILLRLERYPCRINYAKGILETRQQTFKHLHKVLVSWVNYYYMTVPQVHVLISNGLCRSRCRSARQHAWSSGLEAISR